jgi:lipopolysaccharide export system permease protein
MTLAPAALVSLLVAWLSFSLAPQGANQFQLLLNKQDAMTEFDTLVPGRFQLLRDGSRVTYTETMTDDRINLGGVFISEKKLEEKKDHGITVLVGEKGKQEIRPDGNRYLILENGYRYDGNPGQADYRVIKYDTYGALLPKPDISDEVTDRDAIPTSELLNGEPSLRNSAELQWRLSLPILVFIVTLIAVPLARVNPRQGRFLKLLPAILLYMAYLTILIAARSALEKGKTPALMGLWWVHGIFLLIGLALVYWEPLRLKMASRRSVSEVAHG